MQEEFYTYDKKVSCNGVALSAASANRDSGGWVAINEDGGLEIFKEGVYPRNVGGVEIEQFECVFDEFKRDTVKGLGKIYLEHETWEVVCFGMLKEIKGVPSHISNKPVWEVCFLPGGDDSIQNRLKSGGQNS